MPVCGRCVFTFLSLSLSLSLSPSLLVNMTPSKRAVQLEDEDAVLHFFEERLTSFYPASAAAPPEVTTSAGTGGTSLLPHKRRLQPRVELSAPRHAPAVVVHSPPAMPMRESDDDEATDGAATDHAARQSGFDNGACTAPSAPAPQPLHSVAASAVRVVPPDAAAGAPPAARPRMQPPRGVHLSLEASQLRSYLASAQATLESAALTLSQQVQGETLSPSLLPNSQLPDLAFYNREDVTLLGRLPVRQAGGPRASSGGGSGSCLASGRGAQQPAASPQYWILAVERSHFVLDASAAAHALLRSEWSTQRVNRPTPLEDLQPPLLLHCGQRTPGGGGVAGMLALGSGAGRLSSGGSFTSVLVPRGEHLLESIIDPLEVARLCSLLEEVGGFVVRAAPWRLLGVRRLYPRYGLTELQHLLTRLQRERELSLSTSLLECSVDVVEWQCALLETIAHRTVYARADVHHLLDGLHPITASQTDPTDVDRPLLLPLHAFYS
jgi:hypothetical protein